MPLVSLYTPWKISGNQGWIGFILRTLTHFSPVSDFYTPWKCQKTDGKMALCCFNAFVPKTPFLYPLETSENRKIFWCFQGVEKESIGSEWVKWLFKQLFRTASKSGICFNGNLTITFYGLRIFTKKHFIVPQIHNSATTLNVALKLLSTLRAETSSVKILVDKNFRPQKLCDNQRSNVS